MPALDGGVGRMKGQPSDNGYGCLDDGRQPTVPVGRFPARTEPEAIRMVRKTLAYEADSKPGEWRHRLTVLAGIPAYNPIVDRLVESMAFARFDKLDPSWTGRAIYSNPSSRFSVPDDRLHDQARKYVEDGEAWTLYLGHSNATGLWGGGARYLDRSDWATLKIARGPGVFATFGCNGCQLKGDHGEGYGVAAMRNPDGPVAVIGSHGICFAAMVQLATDGLVKGAFSGKSPERLGAAWLAIKAGVAKGDIDDLSFAMLDAVDGDSSIPQATQRLEHLEMFTLLGDPALKLAATPADLTLKTDDAAAPGATVTIHGTAPARLNGARVHVVAERPVSSTPDRPGDAADGAGAGARSGADAKSRTGQPLRRGRGGGDGQGRPVRGEAGIAGEAAVGAAARPRVRRHGHAGGARRADAGRAVGAGSPRPYAGGCNMVKQFDEDGVSFRYPDDWTLEREQTESGWTASLQSKETAFLVVTLDRGMPEPERMADSALEALKTEYPGLDADAAVDMVSGEMAVGHDVAFFSFDLPNTAWTRSLYCGAGTLLLYWQMNDLELQTTEPVLKAITGSLKVEE